RKRKLQLAAYSLRGSLPLITIDSIRDLAFRVLGIIAKSIL
ncbi:MAG: hypothetical protein RJB11_1671, partial [Planctomycetota bacterium]